MKAAIFDGKGVKVERKPAPKLKTFRAPLKYDTSRGIVFFKRDLALIQVEAASICGTDLHILAGTHGSAPPVILGHEYVGTVLQIGSAVAHIRPGDFVAVDPNIKCGYCGFCRKGMPNMCINITTLGIFCDGGFAERNLAPAKQLYKLPEGISPQRAVFFEPLSCAIHGLEKVQPRPGESVLVFGAGPIGCYFTALCGSHGASLVAVTEPNESRHSFAEKMGGTIVMPSELETDSFDVVIDACGSPHVVPEMIRYARQSGRLLLFGQQNENAQVAINPTLLNQKELQVFGSYAASYSFEDAIDVLSDPRIPLERLITHRIGLEDITEAFELMRQGRTMEVLITPEGGAGE